MTPATEGLVGLNGHKLEVVKAETCSNCRYAKFLDIGQIECGGVPPTPVMLGVQQNIAGQPEPMIALFRPKMPSSMAACALWRERDLASSMTRGEA